MILIVSLQCDAFVIMNAFTMLFQPELPFVLISRLFNKNVLNPNSVLCTSFTCTCI